MDDEADGYHHLWGRGRPLSDRYPSRAELEQLAKTPEWMAVFGMITAQEYLARNGLGNRPIEDIANANKGKPRHRG